MYGRFSEQYAKFMADRFYRRYKNTIKVKAECYNCKEDIIIPATLDYLWDSLMCRNCEKRIRAEYDIE
jgi:hypothetical protein